MAAAREDALFTRALVRRSHNARKEQAQALALFGAPEPSQRSVDSFSSVRGINGRLCLYLIFYAS